MGNAGAENANQDSADEARIGELLQELSDCREDERHMVNLMLSVIGTAGTVLGVILTANFLSFDDTSGGSGKALTITERIAQAAGIEGSTIVRICFMLSNIIFCTAFAYVVTLGIAGVMRYHYIRDLEDRLHQLIPHGSDDTKGAFVHWFSYSSAFVSRNRRHVYGVNGKMYFVCYTIAAIGASLFCAGMTLSLFLMIEPKKSIDWFLLSVPILMAAFTLTAFILSSKNAGKEFVLFLKVARRRRQDRERFEEQTNSASGWCTLRLIGYLLYPKTKDLQKPFLIVVGYVLWMLYGSPSGAFWTSLYSGLPRLLAVMFIFDVLFYQARYHFNDLHGLEQDVREGKTPIPGIVGATQEAIEKIIVTVFLTAVLRVGLGVFLMGQFNQRTGTYWLAICVVILVAVTFAYELFRTGWVPKIKRNRKNKKQKDAWWNLFLIMFAVGFGYPLRFAVGILATGMLWKSRIFVFSMIALYCYGWVVVLLPWKNSIAQKSNYFEKSYSSSKQHFNVLYKEQWSGTGWFKGAEWFMGGFSIFCVLIVCVMKRTTAALIYGEALVAFLLASYIVILLAFPVKKIKLPDWVANLKKKHLDNRAKEVQKAWQETMEKSEKDEEEF